MALLREFSKFLGTDRHTHTHTGPITLPLRKRGVMKGTKVLTLGAGREVLPHNMARMTYIHARPLAIRMRYMCIYACAVLLIGGRAGRFTDSWSLTSLLRVGHRVATLLDSTRESIIALRYNFWRLQGTQSCRGKPVLICILALSLVFTPYLSTFQQNRHIFFMPL